MKVIWMGRITLGVGRGVSRFCLLTHILVSYRYYIFIKIGTIPGTIPKLSR